MHGPIREVLEDPSGELGVGWIHRKDLPRLMFALPPPVRPSITSQHILALYGRLECNVWRIYARANKITTSAAAARFLFR